ncbi:hypothetical protein AX16_008157 [Volvariella volvacea WC 439]|nr:hypothetical protein AX16_008157 [Volvariella volvacea WC 439]
MHDSDEQDTCRICSAPAEPDLPLFHPCKCSGTIRYIHQDCLTTWLAHSKKKTCDLCKHPYAFTKVYAPDMPSTLPPFLLLRKLAHQSILGILFALRAAAVAVIWLAVLPWVTVWTWRVYFTIGDTTAWWISDHERPALPSESTPPVPSVPSPADSTRVPLSLYARIAAHPTWQALSADIFAGQVIASLIVLTFVAVFLLREWISQNARPGFFEEEDGIPEDIVVQMPPPQLPEAAPVQPVRHIQELHPIGEAPELPEVVPQKEQQHDVPVSYPMHNFQEGEKRRRSAHPTRTHSPVRSRRRLLQQPSPRAQRNNTEKKLSSKKYPRRIEDRRRRRRLHSSQSSEQSDPVTDNGFKFTFQVDPSAHNVGQVDYPRDPSQYTARRPSLPAMTLSSQEGLSLHDITPPDSPPNLVSYHAPEELQAGPGPSTIRMRQEASPYDMPVDLEEAPVEEYPGSDEAEWTDYESERDYYFPNIGSPRSVLAEDGSDYKGKGKDVGPSEGVTSVDEDDEDDEEAEDEDAAVSQDGQWDEGIDIEEVAAEDVPLAAAVPGNELEGAPAAAQPAQQDGNQAQPIVNGGVDPNEELEGNVEDDMEGAMEAIGMRGPIYGVLQNAALMIFVLDTAIGIGVWLPFTIGKSTALLCLNPHRLLQIVHLPIRAMRFITDPVVDGFLWLLVGHVFPLVFKVAQWLVMLVVRPVVFIGGKVLGSELKATVESKSTAIHEQVMALRESSITQIFGAKTPEVVEVQANTTLFSKFEESFPQVVEVAEPYFAAFGKQVRVGATHSRDQWIKMALGSSASDRMFAVFLGYAVIGLLLALYLNILTVGNARSAGRAVRNAVRQQLLVIKVAAFIFIELVLFPLGCGIVLDLCTVWLFPEANIDSRTAFFFQAPLTAMFYHWVAGTMFMYTFAILLSGCRSVMRPGAMWFIKDPQDQNSHPIRDILDRPTLTQLRKIAISGVMYSFVVMCVVGSVAGLLLAGSKSIMPFRWKNREPLSNVPIDLLFLHLVLPYTMHYFRPKKVLKKVSTVLWRFLSKKLRLTSYFFGERHSDEEYTPKRWRLNLFTAASNVVDGERPRDGSFRRVPATDHLALPREIRATAAVTESGEPVDEEARQLIEIQNAEATKARHNIQEDYMIVYIPPHFRWRIIVFIVALWIIGACFLGLAVALPIQLGRGFFKLFTERDMHDGYSLIIGFYLLWACYLVGRAVDRLDKRRQRIGGEGPRSDLRIFAIKRGLLWTAKITYMVVFLGVVIPTLIALAVDLYILLPIRFAIDPQLSPTVRVVDLWALGLLYAKMTLHVAHVERQNRITLGIQQIRNNGWTHPDPVSATKDVIGPMTLGLLTLIFVPGALFRAVQYLLPPRFVDDKSIFMRVYPGLFILLGLARSAEVAKELLATWSQSIRDTEFLVEMRLKNHEPEKEKVNMEQEKEKEEKEA